MKWRISIRESFQFYHSVISGLCFQIEFNGNFKDPIKKINVHILDAKST